MNAHVVMHIRLKLRDNLRRANKTSQVYAFLNLPHQPIAETWIPPLLNHSSAKDFLLPESCIKIKALPRKKLIKCFCLGDLWGPNCLGGGGRLGVKTVIRLLQGGTNVSGNKVAANFSLEEVLCMYLREPKSWKENLSRFSQPLSDLIQTLTSKAH